MSMYVQKKKLRERNLECTSGHDSKELDLLARTNIAENNVILAIIRNGYTAPETLDYIVNNYINNNVSKRRDERSVILRSVAERKDLSIKSSFKLALLQMGEVTRVLSRTTTYPEIQKILLKRCDDQIVVGNILKATEDHELINEFIDIFCLKDGDETTEKQNKICNSNYILVSLHSNPNLNQKELMTLIASGRAIPEHIIKHNHMDEDVFRNLLNTVKYSEMTEVLAKDIVLSEYISKYETVLKIILLKYPSTDILKIVLSNSQISSQLMEFVYDNYKLIIANSCLFEYAAKRFTKKQVIELLKLAENINGKVMTILYNMYGYTDLSILELMAEKANKSDYNTIKAFLTYMPGCYWINYYQKLSTSNRILMLEHFKCPEEVLVKATESSAFSIICAVAKHQKTDMNIAFMIYDKIRYVRPVNKNQERQDIFRLLERKFGNAFICKLLANPTNRDLYVIFTLSENKQLKYLVAKIIGDRYLNKVIKVAIQTRNEELYDALTKNYNVSQENMILLRDYFE